MRRCRHSDRGGARCQPGGHLQSDRFHRGPGLSRRRERPHDGRRGLQRGHGAGRRHGQRRPSKRLGAPQRRDRWTRVPDRHLPPRRPRGDRGGRSARKRNDGRRRRDVRRGLRPSGPWRRDFRRGGFLSVRHVQRLLHGRRQVRRELLPGHRGGLVLLLQRHLAAPRQRKRDIRDGAEHLHDGARLFAGGGGLPGRRLSRPRHVRRRLRVRLRVSGPGRRHLRPPGGVHRRRLPPRRRDGRLRRGRPPGSRRRQRRLRFHSPWKRIGRLRGGPAVSGEHRHRESRRR